jgi:hypothetical protein
MARFTVVRFVDAWALYETEIEADDAHEAAQIAYDLADEFEWKDLGTQTFDARFYMTLDDKRREIESTRVGRIC